MIRVEGAPLSAMDAFTVSGLIILREDSGAGIRQAELRDRFGVVLQTVAFDCPAVGEIRVDRVERDRLPLTVDAKACNNQQSAPSPPIWVTGPSENSLAIPLPGSALLCTDNPACAEAEAVALRARNEVIERCNDVRVVRGRRDAAAAAAVALATAFVAVLAAAIAAFAIPLFGSVLGAVLLGVAAFLAYMAVIQALVAWREQQALNGAEAALSEARRRFTEAASRANAVCARDCRSVDLNQPEC